MLIWPYCIFVSAVKRRHCQPIDALFSLTFTCERLYTRKSPMSKRLYENVYYIQSTYAYYSHSSIEKHHFYLYLLQFSWFLLFLEKLHLDNISISSYIDCVLKWVRTQYVYITLIHTIIILLKIQLIRSHANCECPDLANNAHHVLFNKN